MSGNWIKKSTPHWAMVMAAARGARRAWPYFANDSMFDANTREVIARGIVVAEECAERGSWCNEAFHLFEAMNRIDPEDEGTSRAVGAATWATCSVYRNWAYSAGHSLDLCVPKLRSFKDPTRIAFKAAVEHDELVVKERSKAESWSHDTPVKSDWFGDLWPNGPSAGLPAATPIPESPRPIAPPEGADAPHHVPDDCLHFLGEESRLAYDAEQSTIGKVYLKRPEELEVLRVEAFTEETDICEDDPIHGARGGYQVRVVNLIASCDEWYILGPLLWYPDERSYGSWDFERQIARLFPGATWGDIAADPKAYLDDLWTPDHVGVPLRAWEHGVFKRWSDD